MNAQTYSMMGTKLGTSQYLRVLSGTRTEIDNLSVIFSGTSGFARLLDAKDGWRMVKMEPEMAF